MDYRKIYTTRNVVLAAYLCVASQTNRKQMIMRQSISEKDQMLISSFCIDNSIHHLLLLITDPTITLLPLSCTCNL